MTDSIAYFGEDQVAELTGLSKRQLRYWDKTDFFSPEYLVDDRRVYSFRDLVGLRAIAPIRTRVPLQELRKVDRALHEEFHEDHPNPWASIKFFLSGKELLYRDPRTDEVVSTKPHRQTPILVIDLEEVRSDTVRLLKRKRSRKDSDIGKLSKRRNVLNGRQVIAGTRIPSSLIWRYFSSGMTVEEIVDGFPTLTEKDVKAAIRDERSRRRKAG